MNASTAGTGQPRNKSINVEVNLLQAWTYQRGELARQTSRHQVILAAVLGFSILFTPILWSMRASQVVVASKAQAESAKLAVQLRELDEQTKSAMPTIERSTMLMRTHGNVNRYLRELREVINAAPGRVLLEQLDSEVIGGEISIKLIAIANDSNDMQRFVDRAGSGKDVVASNQVLARKEGPTSNRIKFDYFKKVRVEK